MEFTRFDAADYLETPEDISIFLQEAAKGNTAEFIHALNTAARAKGMSQIAEKTGGSRASLYKSLSGKRNPSFKTIQKVLDALGCEISIKAKQNNPS